MFSDKWIIKDRDDRIEKTLVSALGLCPLTARLLASRGFVEPSAALDFIEKRGLEFHDPYLLNDMDKDLLLVAKDDKLGRTIQDLNLTTRRRATKKKGD